MNVLVCVKRVPMVGARINITPDGRSVDTHQLGFTISPHEECAVEEAVRLVETNGGAVTVLTLGPPEASEQLRDAAAIGAHRLVHLVTDGAEVDPIATAHEITSAVARLEDDGPFDLILFGNEAPDTGDYQVGVRVAVELGRACVSGVKGLDVGDGSVRARREHRGGDEYLDLSTPCVIAVKEGINLPRYPSLPGRMRARKMVVDETPVAPRGGSLLVETLRTPVVERSRAEVLGTGPAAVPALVALFERLGVLS